MVTSRSTPHISLEFCVNRRKVHMDLVTVVEKVGRTFQPLAAGPMHVHASMHASTLTTDFRNALNLIWKADIQSLPFPRAVATQGRHPRLSPRDAKEERGEPKQARPAPANRDRGGCLSYRLSRDVHCLLDGHSRARQGTAPAAEPSFLEPRWSPACLPSPHGPFIPSRKPFCRERSLLLAG